ncbi:hypothetical protein SAMN05216326_1332 [Nitrosomonas marina]|uniref:Uncharacterized protein n=1 Tax=Nitrosomonas marina TaxID=917 RepID=A0A1I0F323_9PROT|nr:hypothetical protein [Nitrosomonas marina]SET52297.1 hypothetical protein SAMN05216326_1332 [Nitrosomonas marina]
MFAVNDVRRHVDQTRIDSNGAPLNDANFELEVNFLEYWEHHPSGKTQHFSWVTDITITPENLMQLMRAGRAR